MKLHETTQRIRISEIRFVRFSSRLPDLASFELYARLHAPAPYSMILARIRSPSQYQHFMLGHRVLIIFISTSTPSRSYASLPHFDARPQRNANGTALFRLITKRGGTRVLARSVLRSGRAPDDLQLLQTWMLPKCGLRNSRMTAEEPPALHDVMQQRHHLDAGDRLCWSPLFTGFAHRVNAWIFVTCPAGTRH